MEVIINHEVKGYDNGPDSEESPRNHRQEHPELPIESVPRQRREQKMRRGFRRLPATMESMGARHENAGRGSDDRDCEIFGYYGGMAANGSFKAASAGTKPRTARGADRTATRGAARPRAIRHPVAVKFRVKRQPTVIPPPRHPVHLSALLPASLTVVRFGYAEADMVTRKVHGIPGWQSRPIRIAKSTAQQQRRPQFGGGVLLLVLQRGSRQDSGIINAPAQRSTQIQ